MRLSSCRNRPMDRPRLQRLLEDIRAELADARKLDDESRRTLHELADELERLAGREEEGAFAAMPDRLREAMLRFETEHPRLSALLGQVSDTLGKLGI